MKHVLFVMAACALVLSTASTLAGESSGRSKSSETRVFVSEGQLFGHTSAGVLRWNLATSEVEIQPGLGEPILVRIAPLDAHALAVAQSTLPHWVWTDIGSAGRSDCGRITEALIEAITSAVSACNAGSSACAAAVTNASIIFGEWLLCMQR